MKRVTVRSLAAEARLDIDEALIALWDAGFDHISGPGDHLGRGEANRARRALGMATRRERASVGYWARLFDTDEEGLSVLLGELGIALPFSGGQLTKKAQHRLSAAARERDLLPDWEPPPKSVSLEAVPPLEWEIVGHERDCHGPSVEQVLMIHDELVRDFAASRDPISPSGVKSPAMLESAVHRPDTANGNVRKYPTVEMAAAALLHALVHNHPFHNGNKRTAIVTMLAFIDDHGLLLTANENELFKLVLQLAQHALVDGDRGDLPDREVLAVAHWLRTRVRWKESGDRAIPWRELRRVLADLGCRFEPASRGQRMTVTRKLERGSTWWGRKKTTTLTSSFTNVQDGRDVDRNLISRLRHDLQLDDAHGVDSAAFYADAELSPSDFIRSYQGLLRRLAKV